MSVADYFLEFCVQLVIDKELRKSIAYRSGRITKQLNTDFRYTNSETANSFYVGSYGRNTAILSVSDVDLVYVLPYSVWEQYNKYAGNKQSALLQAVRASLQKTYPSSEIGGDGQVVYINFTDKITFEVLPAFLNDDGSYTYPDSNGGGSWAVCKPKHEMAAFQKRGQDSNQNLVELGRMARAWRDTNNVPMTGMLIDTLAYQFMADWAYKDKSYLYYDFLTRDFFAFLASQDETRQYWLAPGSGSHVRRTGKFEYKARQAQLLALEAIGYLQKGMAWTAKQKYREIYGTAFPS